MKDMSLRYSEEDIIKSFGWLSHASYGFTELLAFHPKYKPGRENFDFNLKHGFLPKIWYVKSEKQILAFVKRYHSHTCCYGINPRPSILKNKNNYIRGAKDSDIKLVMNFYLDFDLENENASDKNLEELINEVEFYLAKQEINHPVRAFTGNGYHLLFALPAINVEEQPDIKERLMKFRDTIYYEFSDEMKSLGIRLDNTMDLRRVAKIYGTKKPYREAKLSRFYGKERIEDFVLREYLLSINLEENAGAGISFSMPDKLPDKFRSLLSIDSYIQKLWNNEGKNKLGDVSRTGYDFSLIKECIKKGVTDINDLAAILALRPEGAFQKSGKNKQYIRRTIGNAIYK